MEDKKVTLKDVLERTKNFDQPYAVKIPEGIYEVGLVSFERKPSKNNGYDMLSIDVCDDKDRVATVTCMLELQWIESTLRLIKGLYTHNAAEADKEGAKDKINKFFDSATNEKELQDKCVEVLKKIVEKGGTGWLKVEFKNPNDKYPDRALFSYKPEFRWKNVEQEAQDIVESGTPVDLPSDNLFEN